MKKRYLFMLSLLCINVQAVQMYQWIDEDGSTYISETPPPEGTDFSVMEIDTANTNTFSSNTPETDSTESEKPEESEVEKARRVLEEENCRISQNNMQELSRGGNLLIKDEKNQDKYIEVTEDMREQKIAQTQADIDKYCKKEGGEEPAKENTETPATSNPVEGVGESPTEENLQQGEQNPTEVQNLSGEQNPPEEQNPQGEQNPSEVQNP